MVADLKDVRHYKFGRHRYYLRGSHRDCSYSLIWIKQFKKAGRETEGGASFDRTLRASLSEKLRDPLSFPDAEDGDLAE